MISRAFPTMVAITVAACRPPVTTDLLELTVETDKSAYRKGEPIQLILKLSNRSSRDTTLEFSSGQRYDFQIADSTGRTMWTWSADHSFMQVLGWARLAAGESQQHRERFIGNLAAGKYQVNGSLTTTKSPPAASTTITVR